MYPAAPIATQGVYTQSAWVTCDGITIPMNAKAVVGNATVVNNQLGAGGGYVTLYPSDASRPHVSNLNYVPGQIVPNAFTVGLGTDGKFNIFAHSALHFIADITGYYAPPSTGGLYYHPLPHPIRLLDTRPGEPAYDRPGAALVDTGVRTQVARVTYDGVTIPAGARAVVGNATVVNAAPNALDGYITLYPSGANRPTVSNLNYVPGQIVPNAFTVGLGDDGAFNIFALRDHAHFVVDLAGYFAP